MIHKVSLSLLENKIKFKIAYCIFLCYFCVYECKIRYSLFFFHSKHIKVVKLVPLPEFYTWQKSFYIIFEQIYLYLLIFFAWNIVSLKCLEFSVAGMLLKIHEKELRKSNQKKRKQSRKNSVRSYKK